jgi:hypothetical protein
MPTGRPSRFVDSGIVITDTKVVPGPDRVTASHYEVWTQSALYPQQRAVYVTEDKAMYKAAMFWEGTAKQFDLAWQRDYFKGKRSHCVNDMIRIVSRSMERTGLSGLWRRKCRCA